jgi:methanethiol S-methyltransferase
MTPDQAYALYAMAWLSFGGMHSWLAGDKIKARMTPFLGPYYRLAYNLIAVIHLGAIVMIGAWAFDGGQEVEPFNAWKPALTLISVFGWALMILVLRTYDLARLAGTAQIRAYKAGEVFNEDEPLITTGFHRFVRHPLYAAAFLILWGAAWTDMALSTALWGSFYLFIGSRFEERRLKRLYGETYRDYRRRVPAFIPWRGRVF